MNLIGTMLQKERKSDKCIKFYMNYLNIITDIIHYKYFNTILVLESFLLCWCIGLLFVSEAYTADKNHSVDISETLYTYTLNTEITDFKLREEGKTFHVHKCVISARSSHLEGLCASGKSEAIIIQSLVAESNAVAYIVKYLYLGNKTDIVKNNNILFVVSVAHFIHHKEVKSVCKDVFYQKLTLDNCDKFQ